MPVGSIWSSDDDFKTVDSVGLFETEMYVSGMYGGHGGGKTSSFKRCLFLNLIGESNIADRLVAAIETRPSPLCYLYLLQGDGAIEDAEAGDTAFGCRDWSFACVITGVWPRSEDGTEAAQSAVRWVYNVAEDLFPLSSGAYGADLGPDPRDAALVAEAFGPNRPRLARLKHIIDPRGVLAYACPLPKPPKEQKLIVLVTGESWAGKDFCAKIWVSMFTRCIQKSITARVVSISDATKREYAAATGADLDSLLLDRAYKEQHRLLLTAFFEKQKSQRPRLPEEHFINVVYGAADVDVLFITGMRDKAPVATFTHLVLGSRLLEVHVQASELMRQSNRIFHGYDDDGDSDKDGSSSESNLTALGHRPNLIFDNDKIGKKVAEKFAEHRLLPFFNEELQRLADIVRLVPDFPRSRVEFRHVLGISEHSDGLALCSSLLQTYYAGDWAKVSTMVSCETGGFIFASALALRVNVPLALVREAGKLLPPTVSVIKPQSYVSSLAPNS